MKAAALSGESFRRRDKGDYAGSIAISQKIIWMSCRPNRRVTEESTLWSAYDNIFIAIGR